MDLLVLLILACGPYRIHLEMQFFKEKKDFIFGDCTNYKSMLKFKLIAQLIGQNELCS